METEYMKSNNTDVEDGEVRKKKLISCRSPVK